MGLPACERGAIAFWAQSARAVGLPACAGERALIGSELPRIAGLPARARCESRRSGPVYLLLGTLWHRIRLEDGSSRLHTCSDIAHPHEAGVSALLTSSDPIWITRARGEDRQQRSAALSIVMVHPRAGKTDPPRGRGVPGARVTRAHGDDSPTLRIPRSWGAVHPRAGNIGDRRRPRRVPIRFTRACAEETWPRGSVSA